MLVCSKVNNVIKHLVSMTKKHPRECLKCWIYLYRFIDGAQTNWQGATVTRKTPLWEETWSRPVLKGIVICLWVAEIASLAEKHESLNLPDSTSWWPVN